MPKNVLNRAWEFGMIWIKMNPILSHFIFLLVFFYSHAIPAALWQQCSFDYV